MQQMPGLQIEHVMLKYLINTGVVVVKEVVNTL